MQKIKVLLADDHEIVRQGLRSLMEQTNDIEVVAEAEDGKEAVAKAAQFLPDVVVMDIGMPTLNGMEATRQIKKTYPDMHVLILTMHATEEYISQILQAGASGYVLKKSAYQELLAAIRAVNKGQSYLSPEVSKKVIDEYVSRTKEMVIKDSYESLTTREREILQLLAEGKSNQEIAGSLFISTKTVETHKAHILEKLDLRSVTELVKYAMRKGIISGE
ncbi:MAG: response regulator transcription factor [Ignavibacteriales bacterium]|nr:response regulator transcription factor [Ignavibacteriales bacterium]